MNNTAVNLNMSQIQLLAAAQQQQHHKNQIQAQLQQMQAAQLQVARQQQNMMNNKKSNNHNQRVPATSHSNVVINNPKTVTSQNNSNQKANNSNNNNNNNINPITVNPLINPLQLPSNVQINSANILELQQKLQQQAAQNIPADDANYRHIDSFVRFLCKDKVQPLHYQSAFAKDLSDQLVTRLLYCYVDTETEEAMKQIDKATSQGKKLDVNYLKEVKGDELCDLLQNGDFRNAAITKDRNILWNILLKHSYSMKKSAAVYMTDRKRNVSSSAN